MHFYIVDPQKISQKEFERVQNILYSSLSEYRISGEIVRSTGLRTINQLVENAFAHRAKTIVAVGSDETLHDVINAVGNREMVIGFIPIFPTEVGRILGIKSIPHAAKTIALRRIGELDLGVVNKNYFLTTLNIGSINGYSWSKIFDFELIKNLINLPQIELIVAADSEYRATLKIMAATIINSRSAADTGSFADPTDGVLDVVFLPKLSKWQTFSHRKEMLTGNFEKIPQASIVHVKKIEILSPAGIPLRAGRRVIAKTPAVIEIVPKTLKIIVGKDRAF